MRERKWFEKSLKGEEMTIKRIYCLRDGRVTEHSYTEELIDGLEWYKEYTCLTCDMVMGYRKKIMSDKT